MRTKQVVFSTGKPRTTVRLVPGWELLLAFHTQTGVYSLLFYHEEKREGERPVTFSVTPAGERPALGEGEGAKLVTAFPTRRGTEAALVWVIFETVGKKKCKKQSSEQAASQPGQSSPGSQ